ncbi:Rod shape-determining protein, MreC [Oceanicola granulosus HTCC2516]|uniref:Cell shape-determining protein MreC n=1 Tax=Oceanicola granulosus (strain ATCC BAA-861 / DSM 15982 / KCTC 12143 / HTCC2516) TaxID=314256 RepID=Q2CGZ7_OCEGH|nr:Rod shape-determining protein, MreC [Oceanicola granulosus HTCC2516]
MLVGLLVLSLFGLFLFWRIDSPRVERYRAMVIDEVLPSFDWAMAPVTGLVNLVADFQSYQRLAEQNADLRRELQQMKAWREAALQLEQENAKLRDLNQVSLDPELTWITGVVLADSGSPYRQSVLLNVGSRDGILDGWPVMDGIGLVGRISGVGRDTSRVILLTDTSSRVPITIQPSGHKAVLAGDNSATPPIEFLENDAAVRPGDRVVSSGDGGVFPADILIGQVAMDTERRLRVRLAADYERLEFLRVMRSQPAERITDAGALIAPVEVPRLPSDEIEPPTQMNEPELASTGAGGG